MYLYMHRYERYTFLIAHCTRSAAAWRTDVWNRGVNARRTAMTIRALPLRSCDGRTWRMVALSVWSEFTVSSSPEAVMQRRRMGKDMGRTR